MPDARDVVRRAFQRLGVIAIDETTQPHDDEFARGVLTALFAEMPISEGMRFDFTLAAVPESHLMPLALVLAAEIASTYSAVPPVPRATALVRLRAVNRPQQMDDPDGDGVLYLPTGERDPDDVAHDDIGRWM